MKKAKRPDRYLITVGCTEKQPNDEKVLNHTRYETVVTDYPRDHAYPRAYKLAEEFGLEMAKSKLRFKDGKYVTNENLSPAKVISVSLIGKHKFNYKWRRPPKDGPSPERQAEQYARWLAQRDGIAVADELVARPVWDGITERRKVKRAFWNGSREVNPYSRRIKAVNFGKVSGRDWRGRGESYEPVVTIQIPNWDWDPVEPVEEKIDAASLPSTAVDISHIKEYGLDQKLSNSVRCF